MSQSARRLISGPFGGSAHPRPSSGKKGGVIQPTGAVSLHFSAWSMTHVAVAWRASVIVSRTALPHVPSWYHSAKSAAVVNDPFCGGDGGITGFGAAGGVRRANPVHTSP